MAIAGVATLVAPVPGSRLVSAAIWTSIFSSTASAAINIGTRADEGFSSWQANAFDVLTIVGNLFGAGVLWSRGATVLVNTGGQTVKYALIGSIGTDVIQGVMLGGQYIEQYDAVEKDPNLSPNERTGRLIEIFSSALRDGLLIYINVRASKADLSNLNTKGTGTGLDALSPRERVEKLRDPKATIETGGPQKLEGTAEKGGSHKTKADVDPETDAPHTWSAPKPKAKSKEAAFKDAIGPEHHAKLKAELPALRAKHPELAKLTDDEILALRGYCGDEIKPEFANLRDYQRINNALRTADTEQLTILKAYIDLLQSGLAKLPKHKGKVFRIMNGIDPAEVRKQFRKGTSWSAKSFLSTSHGKPLDHAQVVLEVRESTKGSHVSSVNPFAEREVLFPPGVEAKVVHVFELPGERYYTILEGL